MVRTVFILFTIFFIVACKHKPKVTTVKPYQLPENFTAVNTFLRENTEYNQNTVFFLDFSRTSNQNRFFVVNLAKDSIINRGLVTHGSCNGTTATGREQYSNIENSYCSSFGKYKVGYPYKGKFGLAYKLYGLDESNSNAFARYIVLHAHDCVPDTQPNYPICLSQGCPTVSPNFLAQLAMIIDSSDKPILLWIWDKP